MEVVGGQERRREQAQARALQARDEQEGDKDGGGPTRVQGKRRAKMVLPKSAMLGALK